MAANNIADQAAKEALEKINRFLQALQNSHDRRKRIQIMQEQLLISRQEAEKRIENLIKLTENTDKIPLIATYQASDQKLYDYTIKMLNKYNESPEGKLTPITFVPSEDSSHNSLILTDEAGLEKLNEIKFKYAIEIGGYVSEIPLKKFDELSNQHNVTIISDITEDQFNYINSRTWNDKNNYSYAACKQSDGTYKLAVLSKDYMGKVNKLTREDMFAALVCEKICNTDNVKAVNNENRRIEDLVKKCNNKEPIYITSTRNKSIYLKLENNQITMYGDGEPQVIQKTSENDFEFKKSALIWLNRIAEPMEVNVKDPRVESLLKEKEISIETLLKDHSRTGNENDFKYKDENGKLQFLRPLTEPATEKSELIEKMTSMIATEIGIRGTKALTQELLKPYIQAFEIAMISQDILEEQREKVLAQFIENCTKDFEEKNAPALKLYKQKEIVLDNITKVMNDKPFITEHSSKVRDNCEERMMQEIDEITEDNLPDRKEIFNKEANNITQMVLVNDGDLSNGLKKLISSANIPMNELPIVDIVTACKETINDINVETIFNTIEINITEIMNYVEPDTREVGIKAAAELATQSGQTVKSTSISEFERFER